MVDDSDTDSLQKQDTPALFEAVSFIAEYSPSCSKTVCILESVIAREIVNRGKSWEYSNSRILKKIVVQTDISEYVGMWFTLVHIIMYYFFQFATTMYVPCSGKLSREKTSVNW